MSEIYFAKTRWVYDSYTDFISLAELSGFPVCFVNEMQIYDKSKTYITCPINGEIKEFMDQEKRSNHKAKIIEWNLERPGGSGTLQDYIRDNDNLVKEGFIDQVIVSDKQLAIDTGFHYVPLGSHPLLGEPGGLYEKMYDVVHLMCYSNRRGKWFQEPGVPRKVMGKMNVAPNGWGAQRNLILRLSRYMLNVHQDEFKYMEPLRFALAAAYGLPIITETLHDPFPYEFGELAQMEYPEQFVGDRNWYENAIYKRGLEFRKRFTTDLNFRNCIERYL